MRGAGRTVFRNGTLFDGHRHRGPVDAVVVEDGVITAVHDAGARELLPAGAEEVDLAGGLLAPGFTDAHVHVVQGGLVRTRCDLSPWDRREDYLAAVRDYAARHPEREWIVGAGWAQPAFPHGTPTAAELDTVAPDRPAFLPNRDHHGAWVNTRALEIAGIDARTPDPPHGRIERDAEGRPSGTLHEAAMHLVARHLPETTDEEYYRALLEGQAYLHSVGVVGWQDAIVGDYAGIPDVGPTYARAALRGDLTADVVGALWWDRDQGVEQLDSLRRRRAEFTVGRFRATSVKIMQDGVPENGSAALDAPYRGRDGRPTSNRGNSFVEPAALNEAVQALDADGFQVNVHAIGDRAVRETLDAFAAARAHPDWRERDLRHHIAHLQIVATADVGRFAELGVAANLQALWACRDEQMVDLVLPFLDEDRARWQYRFADLQAAGARLVMGSDWPVTSPDPLAAMHVAVNRTLSGDPGPAGREPLLPAQAVSLETVFAAYTSGSAWVNHADHAGVVAPGRAADLVVLDRNPFAAPAEEIADARVVSTWIGGRPVFVRD